MHKVFAHVLGGPWERGGGGGPPGNGRYTSQPHEARAHDALLHAKRPREVKLRLSMRRRPHPGFVRRSPSHAAVVHHRKPGSQEGGTSSAAYEGRRLERTKWQGGRTDALSGSRVHQAPVRHEDTRNVEGMGNAPRPRLTVAPSGPPRRGCECGYVDVSPAASRSWSREVRRRARRGPPGWGGAGRGVSVAPRPPHQRPTRSSSRGHSSLSSQFAGTSPECHVLIGLAKNCGGRWAGAA